MDHTLSFLVAFLALFAIGECLHCYSHEHCGQHAVCVSMTTGQSPKCMCLVGYNGNGAKCERLDPDASDAAMAKLDQLILEKSGCSTLRKHFASTRTPASSNEEAPEEEDAAADEQQQQAPPRRGPPGFRPPSDASKDPKSLSDILASSSSKHPVFDFGQETQPSDEEEVKDRTSVGSGIQNTKECVKVACNFDKDACRYRSLGDVNWIRKPKKSFGNVNASITNFVATIKSARSTDQYLASENFVLLEDAELSFKYFESDRTPHIQVCDNDLAHCFWQSEGAEGQWTDASVVLPSGAHRMIFAVTDIGAGRTVAIDDIQLRDNGEQAVCV